MNLDKIIKKHALEAREKAEEEFRASIQCQMICGDGTGKKIVKHVFNCPMLKYGTNTNK